MQAAQAHVALRLAAILADPFIGTVRRRQSRSASVRGSSGSDDSTRSRLRRRLHLPRQAHGLCPDATQHVPRARARRDVSFTTPCCGMRAGSMLEFGALTQKYAGQDHAASSRRPATIVRPAYPKAATNTVRASIASTPTSPHSPYLLREAGDQVLVEEFQSRAIWLRASRIQAPIAAPAYFQHAHTLS